MDQEHHTNDTNTVSEQTANHSGNLPGEMQEGPVNKFENTPMKEAGDMLQSNVPQSPATMIENMPSTDNVLEEGSRAAQGIIENDGGSIKPPVAPASGERQEPRPHSKRNKFIAGIAGLAVVLGGGGVATKLITDNANDTHPTPNDKQTSQTPSQETTTKPVESNVTYKSVAEFDIPATDTPQQVAEKSAAFDTAMVSGNLTKKTFDDSNTNQKYDGMTPRQYGDSLAQDNVIPLWDAQVVSNWQDNPHLVSLRTARLQENAINVSNFLGDGPNNLKNYLTVDKVDVVSSSSSQLVLNVTETEHYETTSPKDQSNVLNTDGTVTIVQKAFTKSGDKLELADYKPIKETAPDGTVTNY